MSEHVGIDGASAHAADFEDAITEKIINWEEEAADIINDVKTHVAAIEIARNLPISESIYLNIRTIEDSVYCVQLSNAGFRVVGHAYDTIDADDKVEMANEGEEDEEIYETPYALLDKISPRYVESFGNQLCKQLLHLQQMRTQFNEEDEEDLAEDDNDDRPPSMLTPTP